MHFATKDWDQPRSGARIQPRAQALGGSGKCGSPEGAKERVVPKSPEGRNNLAQRFSAGNLRRRTKSRRDDTWRRTNPIQVHRGVTMEVEMKIRGLLLVPVTNTPIVI